MARFVPEYLEGLFNDTQKASPLSETDLLTIALKGTNHNPSDVVAIGFSFKDGYGQVTLSELYYTVRGAKEREQLDFYNRLGAMLEYPSHLHNFTSPGEIDKCQQRIDDMRENQGIPSPSVADLGGSDGAKRLFLLYTTNPSPHLKSGDAGTSGYKSESVKPSLPDCLTSDIMRNVDLGRIGGKK